MDTLSQSRRVYIDTSILETDTRLSLILLRDLLKFTATLNDGQVSDVICGYFAMFPAHFDHADNKPDMPKALFRFLMEREDFEPEYYLNTGGHLTGREDSKKVLIVTNTSSPDIRNYSLRSITAGIHVTPSLLSNNTYDVIRHFMTATLNPNVMGGFKEEVLPLVETVRSRTALPVNRIAA